MIYQTDPDLNNDFEHVGCAFDCVAYAREKFTGYRWTADQLNSAWAGTLTAGILSSDFVIQDWNLLANFIGAPLHFVGRVDGPYIPGDNEFVITAWYNERTKFTHFVVGDTKPVEWDPIEGGSVTVREGSPVSHRVFQVLV